MNKIFKSALVAILSIYSTHVFAEGTTINYRLASADETRKLMQGNTEYYAKMNQMDIDWRVRKEGSTLAELQTMAWQQTRDWTDAEREFMATIVGMITDSLNSIGCQLPVPSEPTARTLRDCIRQNHPGRRRRFGRIYHQEHHIPERDVFGHVPA